MPKVSTKRSDKRWQDDRGDIWASEFEFRVFSGIQAALARDTVSSCDTGVSDGHSFDYTTPVSGGACMECGSSVVVQRRVYTPDICVVHRDAESGPTFIEAKGYMPATRRHLLRCFHKTGPNIDLVFVLQADTKATKTRTLSEWVTSFLPGVPCFVWNPCARPTRKRSIEEIQACPVELKDFLIAAQHQDLRF